VDELRRWSVEEGPPPLPPARTRITHLYRPYLNSTLWERCRSYLRSREDQRGRRSEERLHALWGTLQWQDEMRRLLVGGVLPDQSLARSLTELVQRTVHEAVAPVGVEFPNPARSQLIRNLATEYNIEHLLWRDESQAARKPHPLSARSNGHQNGAAGGFNVQSALHRYLESTLNNSKPAANYDVVDHMAIRGIPVDLAAVSGHADSDLTQAVLQDARVARLLTDDPFRITLVRTVHGLALGDLEGMRHYRSELYRLTPEQRALITLADDASGALYGAQPAQPYREPMWA
jgi:hypothetical protein